MPVFSVWITLVGKNTDAANKVLRYSLKDMNYNQADSPGSFIGRMHSVTDLLNIYFVCIDKSILESRTVKNGLEPVVEYVSLLFAGQFGDSWILSHCTKFTAAMAKYGEDVYSDEKIIDYFTNVRNNLLTVEDAKEYLL